MTVFEKHPKRTISIILILGLCFILLCAELIARQSGLGTVVLYESSPTYGYRPLPNQDLTRFSGARLSFNNFGLRAANDWDENSRGHVLFVGDSITYGGSYIDNSELFSTLAVRNLPFEAGNAGVNGWGVRNVHGLIKVSDFTPAEVVVSTFADGDFIRGITRLQGQPYWTHHPVFGLKELLHYGVYRLANTKYTNPARSISHQDLLLEKRQAVEALKDYDAHLQSKGIHHVIYWHPAREQYLGEYPMDPELEALFSEYELPVIKLLDRLPQLSVHEINDLYHDVAHLEASGHALWASIMQDDLKEFSTIYNDTGPTLSSDREVNAAEER